ncbi:hypothetical protein CQA86_32640, partial [Klebsiella pneumoniae]
LFAPLLAKMLGARRLLARLLLAALIGALLLWLSDQVILCSRRCWRKCLAPVGCWRGCCWRR